MAQGQLNYEWYDTSTYYTNNGHPTTESGLDAFFDSSNSGVSFGGSGTYANNIDWHSNSESGFNTAKPSYLPADGYGWRVRGYIRAPESGTYTFGVDADDATDVHVSQTRVAYWYDGHGTNGSWSGGSGQTTGTISLTAGQYYYFEARMEEGGGADGIRVGWKKPSDSSISEIPSSYFYDAPPESPSSLTTTVNSNASIDFGWSDNISDISRYRVQINRDGGGYVNPSGGSTYPSSAGTYTYTPNSDNSYGSQVGIDSSFQFRVRAEDSYINFGSYVTSSFSSGKTVRTTPVSPKDVSVNRPDANTVEISWTSNTDLGTSAYTDIEYRKDTGSGYGEWSNIETIGASSKGTSVTRQYTVSNDSWLEQDARYQFRIAHYFYEDWNNDGNTTLHESPYIYASLGNEGNLYFSDDFESGGLGNWDLTELSDNESGVHSSPTRDFSTDTGVSGPHEGSYFLEIQSSDSVTKNLGDLSGENDVVVKAVLAAGSMDFSNESVGIKWYDGSSWQNLRQLHYEYNKQGWVQVSVVVPSSYLSTDNRLRLDGYGGSGDYLGVDEVIVADILHEYTQPAGPSSFTVDDYDESTISTSWANNATFKDGVDKEYKKSSATSWNDEPNNTTTSYTYTGLDSGTTYDLRVMEFTTQARNGSRQNYWGSSWATATQTTTSIASGGVTTVSGDGVLSSSNSSATGGGVTPTAVEATPLNPYVDNPFILVSDGDSHDASLGLTSDGMSGGGAIGPFSTEGLGGASSGGTTATAALSEQSGSGYSESDAGQYLLEFDESDDNATAPNEPIVNAWNNNREVTISITLSVDEINDESKYWATFWSLANSSEGSVRFERDYYHNHQLRWTGAHTGGNTNYMMAHFPNLEHGQLYTLTMVVDYPTNGEAYSYKDGELVATLSDPGDTVDWNVGDWSLDFYGWADMSFEEITVWDRPLSQSEVQSHVSGDTPQNGLIGHWKLNEGSGATANDYALGNDATINGSPSWEAVTQDADTTSRTGRPTTDTIAGAVHELLSGTTVGNSHASTTSGATTPTASSGTLGATPTASANPVVNRLLTSLGDLGANGTASSIVSAARGVGVASEKHASPRSYAGPVTFEDAEDGNFSDWTVNEGILTADSNQAIGTYSMFHDGFSGVNDSGDGTNDPRGAVKALDAPRQVDSFSFMFWETSSNTSTALTFYNSNGNKELSVGTDNPEWYVRDANGDTNFGIPPSDYEEWRRFTVEFDWANDQYTVTGVDLATGYTRSHTGPLKNGVDIAEVASGQVGLGSWTAAGQWHLDQMKINPADTATATSSESSTFVSSGETSSTSTPSATLFGGIGVTGQPSTQTTASALRDAMSVTAVTGGPLTESTTGGKTQSAAFTDQAASLTEALANVQAAQEIASTATQGGSGFAEVFSDALRATGSTATVSAVGSSAVVALGQKTLPSITGLTSPAIVERYAYVSPESATASGTTGSFTTETTATALTENAAYTPITPSLGLVVAVQKGEIGLESAFADSLSASVGADTYINVAKTVGTTTTSAADGLSETVLGGLPANADLGGLSGALTTSTTAKGIVTLALLEGISNEHTATDVIGAITGANTDTTGGASSAAVTQGNVPEAVMDALTGAPETATTAEALREAADVAMRTGAADTSVEAAAIAAQAAVEAGIGVPETAVKGEGVLETFAAQNRTAGATTSTTLTAIAALASTQDTGGALDTSATSDGETTSYAADTLDSGVSALANVAAVATLVSAAQQEGALDTRALADSGVEDTDLSDAIAGAFTEVTGDANVEAALGEGTEGNGTTSAFAGALATLAQSNDVEGDLTTEATADGEVYGANPQNVGARKTTTATETLAGVAAGEFTPLEALLRFVWASLTGYTHAEVPTKQHVRVFNTRNEVEIL